MISDNPNFSLGIVDCSLYTRCFALKDDYHERRKCVLAYASEEFNKLERVAENFIISARQLQFIQENNFNNAPFRQFTIAMITNSAFTGSYTGNPFWYQHFDVRHILLLILLLRGGQPIFEFDAADTCCLYVTAMKARTFQEYIPSIPIDTSKDEYLQVFDLISSQDATEKCHHPDIFG